MNALLIGATGMLWPLVEALLYQGVHGQPLERITLLSRSQETFARRCAGLPSEQAARLHFLCADYHDLSLLARVLEQAPLPSRQSELVIAWIHSSAPGALPTILDHLDLPETRATQVVQLFGSASQRADADAFHQSQCAEVGERVNVSYQRVILGFVREQESSRWLTDREISRGVIDALETFVQEHIVGILKPWHHRP